jgi:hypothetical protein
MDCWKAEAVQSQPGPISQIHFLGSNPAFDVGFVKIIDNFRVFRENIGTCRLADLLEKI